MLTIGRAYERRRLVIPVKVSNGEAPSREIEFEIDTRSDIGLALPQQDIAELGLIQVGDDTARRNGATNEIQSYIAYVEWHDGPTPVNVVETSEQPYAGMGLLWDSYLSAYLFPSGAVFVSRMVHWDDLKREASEE